jgi:hypothetical protein
MMHETLMQGLSVHHLRFTVQPLETIVFNEQPGTALRGALYKALSSRFCSEPNGAITPEHYQRCPVCWMLAAEIGTERGRDVPRPLTVEPPHHHIFDPNHRMTFGFTLIGKAQNLFPYVARAVQVMGELGVGKGRGRFKLLSIAEYNPLLDAERVLLQPQREPNSPTLYINVARISDAAQHYKGDDSVRIELITPLRLISEDHLVKKPEPMVFMRRLLERCQNLARYYAENATQSTNNLWREFDEQLKIAAAQVRISYDDTHWTEIWSRSQHKGRSTPISGIRGFVHWSGEIQPLIPWLLWGQSLHVGKDAVKGNGWYRVHKVSAYKPDVSG